MEICVAFQAHRKDAVFQQGIDRADVLRHLNPICIAENCKFIAALPNRFQQEEWILCG